MDMDEIVKNMGDKLNKARDVAMDIADKAGEKASEVYDAVKLRLKMADIRRDINSLYKEIGMAACNAREAGEDIASVIADKCGEVERLRAELEALSEKISDDDETIEVEANEADEESFFDETEE